MSKVNLVYFHSARSINKSGRSDIVLKKPLDSIQIICYWVWNLIVIVSLINLHLCSFVSNFDDGAMFRRRRISVWKYHDWTNSHFPSIVTYIQSTLGSGLTDKFYWCFKWLRNLIENKKCIIVGFLLLGHEKWGDEFPQWEFQVILNIAYIFNVYYAFLSKQMSLRKLLN